jgi:PTH1 family peptidyl-tRNA hydrolase
MLVDRMAKKWGGRFKRKKHLCKAAQAETDHGSVLLVKPWTYMNHSGRAVKELLESTGIILDRLLVVYDDLDIPLGEVRIRKTGGPGLHKGMGSIVREIKSNRFPRMRIGIGPLPLDTDATDFVLSGFLAEEKSSLETSFSRAEEALILVLKGEITEAMNRFNRKILDADFDRKRTET